MKNKFFIIVLIFYAYNAEAQFMTNLEKYKEDNRILGLPKEDEKRVVFMGNSITESWKSFSPDFFSRNPYVNRGISSETTTQMLIRFRSDVIALEPKAVVILAGINDIAENTGPISIPDIARNIFFMSQLAHENNIKVILCSVLPAIDFSWNPRLNPKDKVIALNKLIQKYAKENNHFYLDYFSALVDERKGLKKEYGEDEVHPNLKGYQVMEPLVQEAITKVLENKN